MKVIRDRELFDKQLLENKEAALQMLKDGDGNYLEEIRIGEQKYKIYTEAADALFFESASDSPNLHLTHRLVVCSGSVGRLSDRNVRRYLEIRSFPYIPILASHRWHGSR